MPSLMTAVKRDVTVRRAIPFGNIPRRAVEEFTTESLIGSILINNASKKRARPNGMIILPVKLEIFAKL